MLPNTSSGNVSQWYDVSPAGNNFHATQGTDANRPRLDPATGKFGNILSLTLDGANDGTSPLPYTRSLILPAGLTVGSQSFSMFAVVSNGKSNALSTIVTLSDGAAADRFSLASFQGLRLSGNGLPANRTFNRYPPSQFSIQGCTSGATAVGLYESEQSSTALGAATAALTTAGGFIGTGNGALTSGNIRILALAIFNTELSPADVAALRAAFTASFNIQETYRCMIWLDGDSIMQGTSSTMCQNEVGQIYPLLKEPTRIFNAGVFGTTRSAIAAGGSARYTISNGGWSLSGSPTKKVVLDNSGTNDTVTSITITNAINNGSGLIQITTSSTSSPQFVTGKQITVANVTGTTEANGVWTVTKINNTTYDLQGSTFTNAYVSGGIMTTTAAQIQADITTGVTNMTSAGYIAVVRTILPRTGLTAAQETMRTTVNTWLRANYLSIGASAISDVDANANLSNPANATYYADGIHLTNAGYTIVATLDAAAINTVI